MEDLGLNPGFWQGRKVIVTGHTGFKGCWLSLWLKEMGASVSGLSLDPPSDPSLFDLTGLRNRIDHHHIDIQQLQDVMNTFKKVQPEIVFHLAAQSLVRPSYDDPVNTFSSNVMGTLHVLEACRQVDSVNAIINVTSDKCYENQEWVWGYRESDPMGGHDPYSCSKGCSELVTSSYRRSFMQNNNSHPRQLASVRAGNVIGGGDWATDRIVPDIMRAITRNQSPEIRNPAATRPWQHVLEPLHGYLVLAQAMYHSRGFDEGWNFGPDDSNTVTVADLYRRILEHWPDHVDFRLNTEEQPHEANALRLDCSKARTLLGWHPLLNLDETAAWTSEWYQAWHNKADPLDITLGQIRRYLVLTEENS